MWKYVCKMQKNLSDKFITFQASWMLLSSEDKDIFKELVIEEKWFLHDNPKRKR